MNTNVIIAHTVIRHTATHLEGRLINTETGEVVGFSSASKRDAKKADRQVKRELATIAEKKGIVINDGD